MHRILRNRYYMGYVSYRGIEYPGKHQPLVTAALFEQVQDMLDGRRTTGEQAYRHTHYLKGSLRCGRCQSRIAYCVSRGNGGRYEYFFCLGQHERRTLCGLPHLPAAKIEDAVLQYWRSQKIEPQILPILRRQLQADLDTYSAQAEQERRRLTTRVSDLRRAATSGLRRPWME